MRQAGYDIWGLHKPIARTTSVVTTVTSCNGLRELCDSKKNATIIPLGFTPRNNSWEALSFCTFEI
jgi:hypothetical protein